jgi:hypothetical protein
MITFECQDCSSKTSAKRKRDKINFAPVFFLRSLRGFKVLKLFYFQTKKTDERVELENKKKEKERGNEHRKKNFYRIEGKKVFCCQTFFFKREHF